MPRSYTCYKIDVPLSLTGRLDSQPWTDAPWTEPFVDILGESAPRPRHLTRAKMLWDAKYLYIGAELAEPHVWATITQRDAVIFYDNDFEVFIDPDGDNHQYYEIEINALNTVWDLLLIKPYRDGGPAVNCWDISGLKTAVHVNGTLNDPTDTDTGWSVEMALPWTSLHECAHRTTPPADGDRWHINFSRVQWETSVVAGKYVKTAGKPEDNWVWSPQGVVDMHRPEQWGQVVFSTSPPRHSSPPQQDVAQPIRDYLMRLYYLEKRYFQIHKLYSSTLHQAELSHVAVLGITEVVIETTSTGFLASATYRHDNAVRRWHVDDSSRLWTSGVI